MAALTWDDSGKRFYETGVSKGVVYPLNEDGKYTNGEAWNGLISVSESPSGADSNPIYADDIKYLDLRSAEEFGATVEAYQYPEVFADLDGTAAVMAGVRIGQQVRKPFGLCYRTILGNDLKANDYNYKLHLIYNATAAPSERAYQTVNDSPEAITFSWELTTTPVPVPGFKPTACLTIDVSKLDAETKTKLPDLEKKLYGDTSTEPELPLPAEVFTILGKTA